MPLETSIMPLETPPGNPTFVIPRTPPSTNPTRSDTKANPKRAGTITNSFFETMNGHGYKITKHFLKNIFRDPDGFPPSVIQTGGIAEGEYALIPLVFQS